MRLIDADLLEKDLDELRNTTSQVDMIKNIIYDQPTVFAVFSGGRRVGKKAMAEYVNMCRVLDDYGIDSTNPAQNLRYVLEQYQRVITELTGSLLSKLTYSADVVISHITDELEDCEAEAEQAASKSEVKD